MMLSSSTCLNYTFTTANFLLSCFEETGSDGQPMSDNVSTTSWLTGGSRVDEQTISSSGRL
jgi:hypothetical protein